MREHRGFFYLYSDTQGRAPVLCYIAPLGHGEISTLDSRGDLSMRYA